MTIKLMFATVKRPWLFPVWRVVVLLTSAAKHLRRRNWSLAWWTFRGIFCRGMFRIPAFVEEA